MGNPSLLRRLVRGLASLAGSTLLGSSLHAAVIQTATVQSGYAYYFDSGSPDPSPGPDKLQVFQNYSEPILNTKSSVGLDYTGQADASSFFFLHNDYCVGLCSVASFTTITFQLYNSGPDVEHLRFDSLITPGHLARFGDDPRVNGRFDFSVTQTFATGVQRPLYTATGQITPDMLNLDTGQLTFRNLQPYDDGQGGVALDWSATNLNLNLADLQPGETREVTYSASYLVNTNSFCGDLVVGCSGAQVVFGDPRTNGAGVDVAADAASLALVRFDAAASSEPVRDLVNREYYPYVLTAKIVDRSTALPGEPDEEPILNYGPYFTPPDVPEPATWATMLLGFAIVGAATRRGRRLRTA